MSARTEKKPCGVPPSRRARSMFEIRALAQRHTDARSHRKNNGPERAWTAVAAA